MVNEFELNTRQRSATMPKPHFTRAICSLIVVSSTALGESAERMEQSVKAAQSRLACCFREASTSLLAMGRHDSDAVLQASQSAWEKYRDAEIVFEVGDPARRNEAERVYHAGIELRLINERIQALERVFDDMLCNPSEIRVRNASDTEIKDVVVGAKKYGNFKPGATTDYQHWNIAYDYGFVSLTAFSKPLKIQPTDFCGEKPLGEGRFTYVLTIQNGQLDIHAEKDAP